MLLVASLDKVLVLGLANRFFLSYGFEQLLLVWRQHQQLEEIPYPLTPFVKKGEMFGSFRYIPYLCGEKKELY